PIANNNRGQVLIQADNSGNSVVATVVPKGPLFTFRETFQTVSLINESVGPMVLNGIQVVNTTPLEPGNQVTLDANSVSGFQFSVNHDFKPTTINVEETSPGQDIDPHIFINGIVNNPIGITRITNDHGGISSTQPTNSPVGGLIITDSFAIAAP